MSEKDIKIPIEVSARHLHLCDADVDTLFGKGYKLTIKRELSQKGYHVANERVEVVGPNGSASFGILLPNRSASQVEMAITDAIKLGIEPTLGDSGNHENTTGCILRGPEGEVELKQGVMIARRHIHMNQAEADALGVKDKDRIHVEVDGDRGLIFKDCLVRVDPSFSTSMHIDTDEGNAANINNTTRTYGRKIDLK